MTEQMQKQSKKARNTCYRKEELTISFNQKGKLHKGPILFGFGSPVIPMYRDKRLLQLVLVQVPAFPHPSLPCTLRTRVPNSDMLIQLFFCTVDSLAQTQPVTKKRKSYLKTATVVLSFVQYLQIVNFVGVIKKKPYVIQQITITMIKEEASLP